MVEGNVFGVVQTVFTLDISSKAVEQQIVILEGRATVIQGEITKLENQFVRSFLRNQTTSVGISYTRFKAQLASIRLEIENLLNPPEDITFASVNEDQHIAQTLENPTNITPEALKDIELLQKISQTNIIDPVVAIQTRDIDQLLTVQKEEFKETGEITTNIFPLLALLVVAG